ncbi:MAG: baseplate J/gp47 family protein [Lactiplantibacillus plantarum]
MGLDLKYGLSGTGLLVPTYEEILDTVQTDLQRRYSQKIPLTGNSNFGILSMWFSYYVSKYYQELQMTYYDAYVTTATDTGLDRQASNAGITRNDSSQSQTTLHIITSTEYLIEAGTQFETDTGVIFDTVDDVVTTKQPDGTWAVDVAANSDDYGEYTNVPANSITIVSDPDENIVSVDNPEATNGGSDRETDDLLRRRIISETVANPSATINGIKTALLNVAGVREVGDVENPTGEVDSYGNPPYTVHLYVLGGAKNDILAALAKYSGFGPLFTGSQSGQVDDVTGDPKTYYFDYATPVPIYVNVKLKTNANWDADSGIGEVKELIADYINGLEMGANVVLTKMYPDIYSLDGVDEAKITISRDRTNLSDQDIQVDKFEAPEGFVDWINVGDPNTAMLTTTTATTDSITLYLE